MECHKYSTGDFEQIRTWYAARGVEIAMGDISSNGFIVPGIAAGFLMLTDTSACILEPFIANPEADPEDRDTALNIVMAHLIAAAKTMRYKRIFGFSNNAPMLARAKKFGFQVIETDRQTVCKEIT